jgi:hypothetical protein
LHFIFFNSIWIILFCRCLTTGVSWGLIRRTFYMCYDTIVYYMLWEFGNGHLYRHNLQLSI